jgi:hypothetical protein
MAARLTGKPGIDVRPDPLDFSGSSSRSDVSIGPERGCRGLTDAEEGRSFLSDGEQPVDIGAARHKAAGAIRQLYTAGTAAWQTHARSNHAPFVLGPCSVGIGRKYHAELIPTG